MQPGSGDYSAPSYYHHYPPNLTPNSYTGDLLTNSAPAATFASAPPVSTYAPPPDYSSSAYLQYPHNPNPDPAPASAAPTFSHPQYAPNSFAPPPAAAAPPSIPASYNPYEPHPPPTVGGNYSTPPSQPHSQAPPVGSSFVSNSDQNSSFYGNSTYPHLAAPLPIPQQPAYESPLPPYYESGGGKYDQYAPYRDENYSRYGIGGPRSGFDQSEALDDGVYRYDGGRAEPYGARGTGGGGSKSSSAMFDDYGRSIGSFASGKEPSGGSGKIVRAVPKADTQQDVKSGVQKFRVKLLPESWGQSTMDVLCQIGLDGIRMLDPNTSRMLRIYPLETVTRWEVSEPTIYTFWSKSSVDVEARRIRLQSNSYTTNTILDTVTAATVQFKEMGGKDSLRARGSSDAGKSIETSAEKKKGLGDWMNMIKPANEEKDHWVPDEAVTKCTSCATDFGAFVRRHHCRNCGDIFCDKCTQGRIALTADADAQPVRVCDRCMAEVTHRLSIAKEAANRSSVLTSHEDLAKKLQEEMDRNRKPSSGSKTSDGSGKRMREVACPTCTVHLQVQVPTSGSETIECGVCQHPFLVSAH